MKAKVLLLKDVNSGDLIAYRISGEEYSGGMGGYGYAQASGMVEIDFPELESETLLKNQLAVIDTAKAKLNMEYSRNLETLEAARQNLLSITYSEGTENV